MEFASANPSVVRSVKQRVLLNAWLRARATPRQRVLPCIRDYQPDRIADEIPDMMGFNVAGSDDDARFLITQEGARLAVTYGNEHIDPAKRTNRYLDGAIDPTRYAWGAVLLPNLPGTKTPIRFPWCRMRTAKKSPLSG